MERINVKWHDPNAFPKGENPYVVGGESDIVFGQVVGFIPLNLQAYAIVQPKHNLKLIHLPITALEIDA